MIEITNELPTDVYEDYWLLPIEIDTLAKLRVSESVDIETGESRYSSYLAPSNLQSRHKKTDIIIAPNGSVVYPQSLYLVYKLRGESAVKDTSSIAKGLLAYTRFLDSTHYSQIDEDGNDIPPEYLTYKSLTKYEEEGAPWRFAEFLLANCRSKETSSGDEVYSLSTAKSYMTTVIGFYKWMQKYGYLQNNDDHMLTHFKKVEYQQGIDHHDMLAHTKSRTRMYEISNIMKIFPRNDATPIHKKLKPMSLGHQALFYKYIDNLPKPFPLMFKLCEATGLRVDEITHFPASCIDCDDFSGLDVVPIRITHTKGSKPRIIEIPLELYEEMEQYKESNYRKKSSVKRNDLIDYLFVSNKGYPYSSNTLEKHFGNLRQEIQEVDLSWYYRVHDLRSTFATNWLWKESQYRYVDYDYLMDELADLMGHSSTSTTEKYIKFMGKFDDQLRVARLKNNKINGGD